MRPGSGTERGSGPITALLALGSLALVVAVILTTLTAVAAREGNRAQHAADAAALAGAEAALTDIPGLLGAGFARPGDLLDQLGLSGCAQLGRADAQRLATENGASITSYCYNPYRDRVEVSVVANDSADGPPARSRAVAETGLDLDSCAIDPSFERPTPTPTPPPPSVPPSAPPTPDPPPPPLRTTMKCGPVEFALRFAEGRFRFVDINADLVGLDSRLID
ncbi:hypothetical protein [Naumannella huperziae]